MPSPRHSARAAGLSLLPRDTARAAAHEEVRRLFVLYAASVERWRDALLDAERLRLEFADKVDASEAVWSEVQAEAAGLDALRATSTSPAMMSRRR